MGSKLFKTIVQTAAETALIGLSDSVSAVQTLVGLEPPSRALNSEEISELRKVYGNSIDYSQIRLKEGFIGINQLLAPHTVCNTIYIPRNRLNSDNPDYIVSRNVLLVHETGHVWQYQNGGTHYICDSLYHQATGAFQSGSRGAAYNFDQPLKSNRKWSELNPEQQAHLMETAYSRGLFEDSDARFFLNDGTDVTAYVRDAIDKVRRGEGAP